MKRVIFTKIPPSYLSEFNKMRKGDNYKRLLIIGIAFFLVQLMVLIQNITDPFTSDFNIMKRYFLFYFAAIALNFIILILMYVINKKYTRDNKILSLLLVAHMFVIHFWAMGVAIADQFQGEDIVVYYLSMFILAILINVSIVELGIVLISLNLLLILLLPLYSDFISGQDTTFMDSSILIFFSLTIRYYLNDLTIKNFVQTKKLVEVNNQLEYLSYYDSLSNLYNRRKWEENYNEMYLRCFDDKKVLSVILLDIDYFKQYNDNYGHVKGDEVIKVVSDSLKTIYNGYLCNIGRYGGDEFIVSLEGISKSENSKLIKKLKESISSLEIENRESKVSDMLSISVGCFFDLPENVNGQWDFVSKADENLYYQKENR